VGRKRARSLRVRTLAETAIRRGPPWDRTTRARESLVCAPRRGIRRPLVVGRGARWRGSEGARGRGRERWTKQRRRVKVAGAAAVAIGSREANVRREPQIRRREWLSRSGPSLPPARSLAPRRSPHTRVDDSSSFCRLPSAREARPRAREQCALILSAPHCCPIWTLFFIIPLNQLIYFSSHFSLFSSSRSSSALSRP
jgi:hypothetical protein